MLLSHGGCASRDKERGRSRAFRGSHKLTHLFIYLWRVKCYVVWDGWVVFGRWVGGEVLISVKGNIMQNKRQLLITEHSINLSNRSKNYLARYRLFSQFTQSLTEEDLQQTSRMLDQTTTVPSLNLFLQKGHSPHLNHTTKPPNLNQIIVQGIHIMYKQEGTNKLPTTPRPQIFV